MGAIGTNRAKTIRRLTSEGWRLLRNGAEHDVYDHPLKAGVLTIPRHRTLSPGVARQIAGIASWRRE